MNRLAGPHGATRVPGRPGRRLIHEAQRRAVPPRRALLLKPNETDADAPLARLGPRSSTTHLTPLASGHIAGEALLAVLVPLLVALGLVMV